MAGLHLQVLQAGAGLHLTCCIHTAGSVTMAGLLNCSAPAHHIDQLGLTGQSGLVGVVCSPVL